MNFSKPILLITFRRPEFTSIILKKIKEIKPKILYVVSDGPKFEKDIINVNKCRKIINNINWCNVKKKFFKKNIGLKFVGPLSINWIFRNEDECIILEDDTIPTKSFFYFCEKNLNKYYNNKKISQISGTNILNPSLLNNFSKSYFFSKYSNIWGWATWKDRWSDYDYNMNKWKIFEKKLNKQCYFKKEYRWWKKMFNIAYYKKNYHNWDYQWTYINFLKKRYSIVPRINLITNPGLVNASGENPKKVFNLKSFEISFPLNHPKNISLNKNLDRIICNNIYSMPNLSYRIKNKIKKYLNFLKSLISNFII